MTDNLRHPAQPRIRASPRNLMIFATLWLGEAFLILMFVKWVIHGSASLYLFMVPWTLFGLILIVWPKWILRVTQAWEKKLERVGENLERRPPPGFP
jgi:hypothetical protein